MFKKIKTWQWYSQMDAALQGQDSISPPLVVSANLTVRWCCHLSVLCPSQRTGQPATKEEGQGQ